ncbi:hypothetical protein [Bacillus suaedae]|nr:hypothetical protein [Bacillus suaedae]
MDNQRIDRLNNIIEELQITVDKKTARKLELDKCKSLIQRLNSFSAGCEECDNYLIDFEKWMIELSEKENLLDGEAFKHHKQIVSESSSHLQKNHKLVPEGYYLSIYMSIGTSIGLVLGLLIFNNIGLGLPIGIGIGVAIGAGLDADAKKKGLTF